ncbi:hypothetical protein Poli38472_010654 [Pythium oligandrum]|uniref:Uncharacterized protein n=1 Tax=Pythium oligandrum TaxID=41045 RepID=A0A8K1FDN3_PYTOL|nr:hypothetical protein Poli38472_010654 [Pythium oligandrum]|eukprot:TMW55772.1 hypothetical protein Poli38472_010654 [Pythium oligandrum]
MQFSELPRRSSCPALRVDADECNHELLEHLDGVGREELSSFSDDVMDGQNTSDNNAELHNDVTWCECKDEGNPESPVQTKKLLPLRMEHFVRRRLAQVVQELSEEKENLRLAASAGSSLLEQLSVARIEMNNLRDESEARKLELDTAGQENQRLREICAKMESELRKYDAAWAEVEYPSPKWEPSSSKLATITSPGKQTILRAPVMTPADRDASCQMCDKREAEVVELQQACGELKRRCLDLELRNEQCQTELLEMSTAYKKTERSLKRVQADHAKALTDVDFMASQIKIMKDDNSSLVTSRDNLRGSNRRLQAENDALSSSLEEHKTMIEALLTDKRAAVLQATVLESRISSLQIENERLRLESTRQQNQLQRCEAEAADLMDCAALQRHVMDIEALLEDANRQLIEVRRENRLLSSRLRTSNAETSGMAVHRPEQTPMTVAEVLAMNPAVVEPLASSDMSCGKEQTSCADENKYQLRKRSQRRPPSIAYVCTSTGEKMRLPTLEAPSRRRSSSLKNRGSRGGAGNSVGSDEGVTAPVYLGLSLLACATAVRYIVKG